MSEPDRAWRRHPARKRRQDRWIQAQAGLPLHCPTCGAHAEDSQLVCLDCGGRLGLSYHRPPSWWVPTGILVVVLALVGGATAYALRGIGDDARREADRTPITQGDGGASEGRLPANAKRTGGLVPQGTLFGWPRDLRAFTVVLLSSEDRASADTFARSASEGRPAKIGVLRGDDFRSLPRGSFVVFAGQYKDRPTADKAAKRLERRFAGAVVKLVEG